MAIRQRRPRLQWRKELRVVDARDGSRGGRRTAVGAVNEIFFAYNGPDAASPRVGRVRPRRLWLALWPAPSVCVVCRRRLATLGQKLRSRDLSRSDGSGRFMPACALFSQPDQLASPSWRGPVGGARHVEQARAAGKPWPTVVSKRDSHSPSCSAAGTDDNNFNPAFVPTGSELDGRQRQSSISMLAGEVVPDLPCRHSIAESIGRWSRFLGNLTPPITSSVPENPAASCRNAVFHLDQLLAQQLALAAQQLLLGWSACSSAHRRSANAGPGRRAKKCGPCFPVRHRARGPQAFQTARGPPDYREGGRTVARGYRVDDIPPPKLTSPRSLRRIILHIEPLITKLHLVAGISTGARASIPVPSRPARRNHRSACRSRSLRGSGQGIGPGYSIERNIGFAARRHFGGPLQPAGENPNTAAPF